jgi:Holliday junction resolvasome RuvABC endonuclease subunit
VKLIVGLDLSLAKTGVGIITQTVDGRCVLSHGLCTSEGKRADSLPQRHARLSQLGKDILRYAGNPKTVLVVIEGAISSPGGSMMDRHALHWFVMGGLVRKEIPIAVIHPTSLKKVITDNGKADKVAVSSAMHRLWPDLDAPSSDVTDAVALAHLGAVALGWDVKTLERHKDVKWTEWPMFGPEHDQESA